MTIQGAMKKLEVAAVAAKARISAPTTHYLYCSESYVHVENLGEENEKRMGLGDNEPYQTSATTLGQLYRLCLREHGRCVSKVYVGDGQPVGWVFLKKSPRAPEGDGVGLIETWVTVYTKPPERQVTWTPGVYPDFTRRKVRT